MFEISYGSFIAAILTGWFIGWSLRYFFFENKQPKQPKNLSIEDLSLMMGEIFTDPEKAVDRKINADKETMSRFFGDNWRQENSDVLDNTVQKLVGNLMGLKEGEGLAHFPKRDPAQQVKDHGPVILTEEDKKIAETRKFLADEKNLLKQMK